MCLTLDIYLCMNSVKDTPNKVKWPSQIGLCPDLEQVIHFPQQTSLGMQWLVWLSLFYFFQVGCYASMNKKIYAMGGGSYGKLFDSVECFDPKTQQWTGLCPLKERRYKCLLLCSDLNNGMFSLHVLVSLSFLFVVHTCCMLDLTLVFFIHNFAGVCIAQEMKRCSVVVIMLPQLSVLVSVWPPKWHHSQTDISKCNWIKCKVSIAVAVKSHHIHFVSHSTTCDLKTRRKQHVSLRILWHIKDPVDRPTFWMKFLYQLFLFEGAWHHVLKWS